MAFSRFGLIGDVHAEHELLEYAIEELSSAGAEVLLCVGDIVDGPGNVERCVELLVRHNVLTVRGNHDRWMLEGTMRTLRHASMVDRLSADCVGYVRSLPPIRVLETDVGSLLLCHGLGVNDMAELKPRDEGDALRANDDLHRVLREDHAFVVGGHTHRPMARRFAGTTLINAGTLYRDHQPGFVLLDVGAQRVTWFAGDNARVEALPTEDEPL